MSTIVGMLVALAAAGVLGGAAVVYSGLYDIGADVPHWPVTYRILETVRVRSVAAHAGRHRTAGEPGGSGQDSGRRCAVRDALRPVLTRNQSRLQNVSSPHQP